MNRRIYKLSGPNLSMELGHRTLIMGILNVTPDSFSDGGKYVTIDAAVAHARKMVEEGADIIDIGGESTRPGAEALSLEEELQRVITVIEALRREIEAPISVDTYKAEVARQSLEAGAQIINDVWGLKADPGMAVVAAQYGCPVILMHNRQPVPYKGGVVRDVMAELLESVELARRCGIAEEQIILDPGIGFEKDAEENLLLLRNLDRIAALGYPILLGTSRKRFIRTVLNFPPDDVVEGNIATAVLGISLGCHIVRVHEVKQVKRAAMMADAVVMQQKMLG